jgi:hypothetical protein
MRWFPPCSPCSKSNGRLQYARLNDSTFTAGTQRISLDDQIQCCGRFLGAVGVEFDFRICSTPGLPGHCDQHSALTGTGIDYGTGGTEDEPAAYPFGNGIRQRVKIHPQSCIVASYSTPPEE